MMDHTLHPNEDARHDVDQSEGPIGGRSAIAPACQSGVVVADETIRPDFPQPAAAIRLAARSQNRKMAPKA